MKIPTIEDFEKETPLTIQDKINLVRTMEIERAVLLRRLHKMKEEKLEK
jgi:hypothetical protein